MTTNALDERDRLHAEAARAREARAAHSARAEQIRAELKAIPKQRKQALQRQARTGEPAKGERLDGQVAALNAELVREVEAAKAASEATKRADRELVELHFDRFGEFAEAAEELSEAATELLAALRRDYETTWRAIEAARAEWSLIAQDHNRVLIDRSDPAERAAGVVRQRQLSPPPANPLRLPAEVFGSAAIRPPEMEPLAEGA